MSTFTQFNGQQGSGGASARDIAGFIEAYNNLSVTLKTHMSESIDTDFEVETASNGSAVVKHGVAKPVHGFATYIDKVASKLATVESLSKKADKDKLEELKNKVEELPSKENVTSAINEKIEELMAIINEKAEIEQLANYAKLNEFKQLNDAFNNFFTVASAYLSKWEHTETAYKLMGSIRATEKLIGMLHALKTIDYIKWSFVQAPFSGTGSMINATTNGVYVLAKISDVYENETLEDNYKPKAGRLLVKYVNTAPFDAIVDFTTTYDKTGKCIGALTALCTKQTDNWKTLKFHIIQGTTADGKIELYLAMSDSSLSKEVSNSPALQFRVAGVNIIPFKEPGFTTAPIGLTHEVATVAVRHNGLSASSVNVDGIITDQILDMDLNSIIKIDRKEIEGRKLKSMTFGDASYDVITFYRRPSMMYKDPATGKTVESHLINEHDFAFALLPIGAIVRWGLYHEENTFEVDPDTDLEIIKTVLDEVPAGWLPCDGSQIDGEKYPELHKLHSGLLPIEDMSIIKATKNNILPTEEVDPDIDTILTHIYLNEKIIAETKRAMKAEQELDARLDTETERAKTAEKKLREDLETETNERIVADITELERAQAAEKQLQDNIDKETLERIDAVANEKLRAEEAETKLKEAFNEEIERSKEKDAAHDEKFKEHDEKLTEHGQKIDKVTEDLTNEIINREAHNKGHTNKLTEHDEKLTAHGEKLTEHDEKLTDATKDISDVRTIAIVNSSTIEQTKRNVKRLKNTSEQKIPGFTVPDWED